MFVHKLSLNQLSHCFNPNKILTFTIPDRDDIIDLLIKNGANVNLRDSEGQTPLHLATRNGNLIHRKCDPLRIDKSLN